ncbi:MAG: flagellar export chaperone FliS [Clostridiales bacterium]|jgi:flagellar protein FliS|nr:flagellar export chaperone FliS [Clostridiales bacterium]
MAVTNPYQHYRQTQVSTSNGLTLVVLLYDGAITFIRKAKDAKANGQTEEMKRFAARAQDIVFELWATLDLDAGEVAGNLYRLYEYISDRLSAAMRGDDEALEDSMLILNGLREAWSGISGQTPGGVKDIE